LPRSTVPMIADAKRLRRPLRRRLDHLHRPRAEVFGEHLHLVMQSEAWQ
jgi:hypothetical protein